MFSGCYKHSFTYSGIVCNRSWQQIIMSPWKKKKKVNTNMVNRKLTFVISRAENPRTRRYTRKGKDTISYKYKLS